ncbi:aspartate aminotransferase family protein [Massilia terrae]
MHSSPPLSTAGAQSPDTAAFWMPFTANRRFKANPIIFSAAEGMHYITPDGRRILDGTAGLWCVNAGHCRPEISDAIARQARELDYGSAFQLGHPRAFEFAERIAQLAPADLNHVFFTNSGSEAVDTALKIALAYQHARGETERVRVVGRQRGYHGMNFGGTSVGGNPGHRRPFGNLLASVDHLVHTYNREQTAFTRGQPAWGGHLADDLLRIIAEQGAETIAAVIVEPVAGSTGVLPPPVGYLERLREICTQYGIVLIFDEVITGFGRVTKGFASNYYKVLPDIITCAKGINNGAIPMGAVVAREFIHDALMHGPINSIELPHGYTCSGHPIACAAGLATLDVMEREGLFEGDPELIQYFEDAAHSLKGVRHVLDIRTTGMLAAFDLAPVEGMPGKRSYACHLGAFEKGVLVRSAGDATVISPPLIISRQQIDQLFGTLADVLNSID